MSDISTEELKKEINAILKTADLTVISAKNVREQVEKKLKCSLVTRKKEIDGIVMDFIDQQNEDGGDDNGESSDEDKSDKAVSASEEEDVSSDQDKKKPKKRPQPVARKSVPKKKRKSLNASDSGTESDGGSDSDYEQPKIPPKKKTVANSPSSGATTGKGRKTTGFTRPYNLSPDLSALMGGAEALPRHEVVKKVWALIKERNLYDPKNKQFAICDDELLKVMGVKRFRTFAMLKYLKPHFLN